MSRIDELIYSLEAAATQLNYAFNKSEQEVLGKKRLCCSMCGHCPEVLAEWLREIKRELQANTKPENKLAQGVINDNKEGE